MRKEVLRQRIAPPQVECVVIIGVGHKQSYVSVCVISEFNNDSVFWSLARD